MKKKRRFTEASRLKPSAPVVVVAPTLQKLLTGDAVRAADWARFVKAIQVFQEIKRPPPDFIGGVTLPPEFAEKLSAVLARGADWNVKHGTKRVQDARARKLEWQKLADKVWQGNRDLSESAVAKMIAPHVRAAVKGKRPSWQTIRLGITKPKNNFEKS